MPELLQEKTRKARKEHRCDYCGGVIKKGERYEWAKCVDGGQLYEWKTHLKCDFIAGELYEYADPDDGMSEEDFDYACQSFCQAFVCPDCSDADKDTYHDPVCKKDKLYCIDKIYAFLHTHELYKDHREGWFDIWKCKERKVKK